MEMCAYLLLEIGLDEFKGIKQRSGASNSDISARLFLAHALNDGGQDLVGLLLNHVRFLWIEFT